MGGTAINLAPLIPWAIIVALGVIALGLFVYSIVKRARGALWRGLAAAALLTALINTVIVDEDRKPLKDIAAIVVDATPSQNVGERRAQLESALAELQRRLKVMEDTLDVRTIRVEHDSIASDDEGTQLFGPLGRLLSDVPQRRLAGAIIITDGQVHDVPDDLRATGLSAPVHVLLTGEQDEGDRRLVVLEAPSYGIVGKELLMTVRIEGSGLSEANKLQTATLTVLINGTATQAHKVPVGVDSTFEVILEHRGLSVLELSVEPGARELTLANNRAVVQVNGVQDRLRVLLVSGEPHAGERTWRNLLKSDPSVDLVHFTILRPPGKQEGTPKNELSLISFPTRELFEVKIDGFDLVIFDRYRRRGVLPPVYLQNIADYVSRGGALLEAVGPTFAGPFSIFHTPLGEVLPGEPTGAIYERRFRPQITEMGHRHPVTMQLPAGPARIDGKAFGEPGWGRWFRQIDVEAKRGRVLMSGIENRPLLILDRVGEGRVAQLNSDHIWLWARGFEGGGPQAELLRRLAHWLMKEPELEENDLRAQIVNDALEIIRRNVDRDEKSVEVTLPDGQTVIVKSEETSPGVYRALLPIDAAGLYRVSDGDRVTMAAAGALNSIELADLRASPDLLTTAVESVGGAVRWLNQGVPQIRSVRPDRRAAGQSWIGLIANRDFVVTGINQIPLMPALLILFLALGATALAWRREGD
jgi:hypothetical protein